MKSISHTSNPMFRFRSIAAALLAAALITPAGVALAQTPPQPEIVAPPAELAASFTTQDFVLQSDASVQVAGLKAVLIVGPIDGDDGTWTQAEIDNLETAADQLEAYGVEVNRFYTPINDWDLIRATARGAHFLMYRGHGLRLGSSPNSPVGGFVLKDGIHSPDELRSDLELHPNAIVMLYGCYTAGSSSDETTAISSGEAIRRVGEYSDPFFDRGASGYYANWFGDAFSKYIQYLFEGKTLGEAYESYHDFNPASVERYSHPTQPNQALFLDKDNWDGIKYNNAFAGDPNATLESLFAEPAAPKLAHDLVLPVQVYIPAVVN